MWILVFTGVIPLQPVAMGRPRAGKGGRMYTPKTSRDYLTAAAAKLCADFIDFPRIASHISIRVESQFVFKRPSNLRRKKDANTRIYKTSRPDIDNLEKMLYDLLGNLDVWHDDSQIVSTEAEKLYTDKVENPATYFKIFIWR